MPATIPTTARSRVATAGAVRTSGATGDAAPKRLTLEHRLLPGIPDREGLSLDAHSALGGLILQLYNLKRTGSWVRPRKQYYFDYLGNRNDAYVAYFTKDLSRTFEVILIGDALLRPHDNSLVRWPLLLHNFRYFNVVCL